MPFRHLFFQAQPGKTNHFEHFSRKNLVQGTEWTGQGCNWEEAGREA